MFTRQHYKAIAEIIKEQQKEASKACGMGFSFTCKIGRLAIELADYFAKDNPRFDRERFLAACGLTE